MRCVYSGAWDNAKKYVESKKDDDSADRDLFKHSEPHKAAVVGDTIGGMWLCCCSSVLCLMVLAIRSCTA